MGTKTKETRLIKFVGIDEWNRPIFKVLNVEPNYYLSDVDNLFSESATEKEVLDFYKDKIGKLKKYLTYHGKDFDSEPDGSRLKESITLKFAEC